MYIPDKWQSIHPRHSGVKIKWGGGSGRSKLNGQTQLDEKMINFQLDSSLNGSNGLFNDEHVFLKHFYL